MTIYTILLICISHVNENGTEQEWRKNKLQSDEEYGWEEEWREKKLLESLVRDNEITFMLWRCVMSQTHKDNVKSQWISAKLVFWGDFKL